MKISILTIYLISISTHINQNRLLKIVVKKLLYKIKSSFSEIDLNSYYEQLS